MFEEESDVESIETKCKGKKELEIWFMVEGGMKKRYKDKLSWNWNWRKSTVGRLKVQIVKKNEPGAWKS